MGLGPQALNLTFSLWMQGHLKGMKRVIELGSQDLHCDPKDVTRSVSTITQKPDLGTIKTAKALYLALGFEDYKCIDTDGRHDALVFNLNEDVKVKGFQDQFNLVTNHGTSEHCFDQQNVFRNIHNLCAKDGIMIHALPFQGYLNHGFYNYHPNFYSDLATANGYEMIGIFVNIDAETSDLTSYSSTLMKHLSMTPLSTMGLFAVMRKLKDEEFRTPFQGKYAGDALLGVGYELNRIPSAYFDLAQIAWEISGKELARILCARAWRKFKRMLGFR
jgi:hypothetical protein